MVVYPRRVSVCGCVCVYVCVCVRVCVGEWLLSKCWRVAGCVCLASSSALQAEGGVADGAWAGCQHRQSTAALPR